MNIANALKQTILLKGTGTLGRELLLFLKKQKLKKVDDNFVLPRLTDWNRSAQAKVLKTCLFQISLPPVKFHTL